MQRIALTLIALSLIALAWLSMSRARAADAPGEAKQLFNGKDLQGWDGDAKYWSVEDGTITGRSTAENPLKKNSFIIWTGGKLRDFELRVKYKIASGNSGIQYRSKDNGDHVVSGYQADIVADTPDKYSGILYEEKGRGILAQRGEQVEIDEAGKKQVLGSVGDSDVLAEAIKKGDWNQYTITARGNKLVHQINGETTIEVTDNEKAKAAREGILALQIHQGPPMVVQFKDIELIELGD